MAKTLFVCSQCGNESPKWHGRCPGCGEWNTMVEERAMEAPRAGGGSSSSLSRRSAKPARPVPLLEVEAPALARFKTGIGELDRVLGGGIVPGSLVLIGGAPGIGKSTITGGALGNLAAAGRQVLYVSGEESAAQVRLRAERLGEHALQVPIVAETDLETVVATLEAERPDVCVVDSVQTLYANGMTGAPGSVGQVREVAGTLMRVAKERNVAVILVGHVTKEGALAGPRVLEHLVDCVLQFEGERERTYRTLRALKNRFGSTNEVGVFEMRDNGLVEVEDASSRFVEEATRAPGSVVLCAMEGSRPLLVELQALVAPTELVPPRRVANGVVDALTDADWGDDEVAVRVALVPGVALLKVGCTMTRVTAGGGGGGGGGGVGGGGGGGGPGGTTTGSPPLPHAPPPLRREAASRSGGFAERSSSLTKSAALRNADRRSGSPPAIRRWSGRPARCRRAGSSA